MRGKNAGSGTYASLPQELPEVVDELNQQKTPSQGAQPGWRGELAALRLFFCHPLYLLLAVVPFGLRSRQWGLHSVAVFFLNFFSIVPLANINSAAIEAFTVYSGTVIGGLIEGFFGKVVEQIMAVQCMKAGLVEVLQGNLMGSLHWNLLLVLGMAIFLAGVLRSEKEQSFNPDGAAAQMSCQVVASISIVLPTMYRNISGVEMADVLWLSRICSFCIMIVYLLFLFFHLKTHAVLFDNNKDEDNAKSEKVQLSCVSAFLLMTLSAYNVYFCSELVVDSIPDVSAHFGIPKAFIGCTLLPIIGNTAEHIMSVSAALQGRMDNAIVIAVGSATQIALFVVPGAVLWGWVFDEKMSLNFRNFDATVMMLSTLLCSQVLQHGNSNWLHGAMLMTTYTLIAVISWFIPEKY